MNQDFDDIVGDEEATETTPEVVLAPSPLVKKSKIKPTGVVIAYKKPYSKEWFQTDLAYCDDDQFHLWLDTVYHMSIEATPGIFNQVAARLACFQEIATAHTFKLFFGGKAEDPKEQN